MIVLVVVVEEFSKEKNLHLLFLYSNLGISAHGMGIIFSNVYPGSISDTDITEKTGVVLGYVNEGHEVMTDKGFSIQDLCACNKGCYA